MQKTWVCSACGSPRVHVTRGSYAYKESGLENITLEGVDLIHCDKCGNEDPIIPNIEWLHGILAEALISKPGRLESKEVRFLRKQLEFSAREIAKILRVDHTTVSKWENGEYPVGPQSDLLLRALVAASKEGTLSQLLKKLEKFDEEISALDIIINAETNEIQYA